VPLVIGAFTALGEAEAATRALLDEGWAPERIAATARVGGGRYLLADRVPVRPVGEPARLTNRAERTGASAVAGAVLGAILTLLALLLLPALGVDPLGPLRGVLSTGLARIVVVLCGAAVGGGMGALLRRSRGLPHELAVRYAVRLDQGDTVLAVRAPTALEARAAQESMATHGAILAHVTAGTLEPLGEPPPLPTPAGAPEAAGGPPAADH
jgi:hypothetical protein